MLTVENYTTNFNDVDHLSEGIKKLSNHDNKALISTKQKSLRVSFVSSTKGNSARPEVKLICNCLIHLGSSKIFDCSKIIFDLFGVGLEFCFKYIIFWFSSTVH